MYGLSLSCLPLRWGIRANMWDRRWLQATTGRELYYYTPKLMRDDVIHHAIFTDSQEEKLYMPPCRILLILLTYCQI